MILTQNYAIFYTFYHKYTLFYTIVNIFFDFNILLIKKSIKNIFLKSLIHKVFVIFSGLTAAL